MANLKRALVVLAALTACGQPLVDSSYRGTPLAKLDIKVDWSGTGAPPDGGVLAAIFFAPSVRSVDPAEWKEATGTTTPVAAIPSAFTMNVFAWPSPEEWIRDGGGDFGIGRILVYQDGNGNGRFDPGEALLGIDPPEAIFFGPAPLDAAHSPTGRALPQGLTSLILPQRCVPPPEPTEAGDCGVPLGAHCSVDPDCGANGRCLKETKLPWRAGYCIVAEPVPDGGCRPGAGAFEGVPRYSLTPPDITGFWLRACTADADCARPSDRDQGLYVCDLGLGACTPLGIQRLVPLGDRFEVEPFCASDHRGP